MSIRSSNQHVKHKLNFTKDRYISAAIAISNGVFVDLITSRLSAAVSLFIYHVAFLVLLVMTDHCRADTGLRPFRGFCIAPLGSEMQGPILSVRFG
jgi:hypothetical protein